MIEQEASFPAFPQMPLYESGVSLNRSTSELTEGSTEMCVADVKENFFSSADIYTNGQVEIVAENDVSRSMIEGWITVSSSGSDDTMVVDPENTSTFMYAVTIFISKDASYLKKAFDATDPADDEVAFFLEDNSTDIFSSKTAYLKIGSNFKDDLEKRIIIADEIATGSEFSNVTNGTTYTLDYNDDEIRELVKTGELSNPAIENLALVIQCLSFINIVFSPLYSTITELLNTDSARKAIEFDETSWNPYAEGNNPDTFEPYLFRGQKELLDDATAVTEETLTEVSELIKKVLENKRAALNSITKLLSKNKSDEYDQLQSFLDTCFQFCNDGVTYLLSVIDDIVDIFTYLESKWLNALNAFYCGLWNGLMEIGLGFIDMITMVLSALAEIGEMEKNSQSLIPDILEMLDEAVQAIMSADIIGIIKSVFSKLLEGIKGLNLYALTNSISIEQVAYFIGGIIGFVVELVLDEFISGGTKGVVDFFKKFATVGENVMEKVLAKSTKLFNAASGVSVVTIADILQYLIDLLKKGKEEILKWVDEFIEILEVSAELAEELINKIKELLKLTSEEISLFLKQDLAFVKLVDNAQETACSLCKISYK